MGQEAYLESLRPTPEEVDQNYGYRERYEVDNQHLEGVAASTPKLSLEACNALVSAEAHDLVWSFEVDGQRGYDKKYCHPCWPTLESGVTIGIGYDLGMTKPPEYAADWQQLMSADDFARLRDTVGRTGGAAKASLANVHDIVVPWAAAEAVYRAKTVLKYVNLMMGIYPGAGDLHAHCSGALFSLVYNRGAGLSGDRRIEMRNIADAIRAGKPELVPNEFRRMKRLWPDTPGLPRRREAEANLFERGLVEMQRRRYEVPVAAAPRNDTIASAAGPRGSSLESIGGVLERFAPPTHDGDGAAWSNADYDPSIPPAANPSVLEAAPAWSGVHWIADDDLSTEYRHILGADRWLKDASFLFSAPDLELLIRANHFQPLRTEKRIIFGLRGTLLEHDTASPADGSAQVNRQSLRLKAGRPDHENFRCVVGVYNTETQLLSGFLATTVPNRVAVWSHYAGKTPSNMLPCGCYRYRVGPHKGHDGCLRQDEAVAVLRSKDNMVFDVKDTWDVKVDPNDWPMDNIHPACADKQSSALFSSYGCQTPRGWFGDGNFTDEFAKFRAALGLRTPGSDNNRLFSYVLLTGHEAAIAAHLRTSGQAADHAVVRASLVRLRQGSEGEPVRRLQAALGLPVDGRVSAVAKKAIAEAQRQRAGALAGDGIFSPQLDVAWASSVFGEGTAAPAAPPAPMVVASAATGSMREGVNGSSQPSFEAVFFEIGRRAELARREPDLLTAGVIPQYEAISRDSWQRTVDHGRNVFARIDQAAHELICGDNPADRQEREKVQMALTSALGRGAQETISVLSNILTAELLIPQLLARPISEIIVGSNTEKGSGPQSALATTVAGFGATWGRRLFEAAVRSEPPSSLPTVPAGDSDAQTSLRSTTRSAA